jgi:hypothetical protein
MHGTLTTSATIVKVPSRQITGRYLAHNRLDARGRARLAADLIAGRVEITTLTNKQIMAICRANAVYVGEARDPGRVVRSRKRRIAKAWDRLDADHRAELCRTIGVENVWIALASAL